MDAVTTTPARSPAWRDDLDVRRAWACLVSAPLAAVVAFAAGSGIATAFGVDEGDVAPAHVGLLALMVALVLFAVPTGFAWRFANRARARGDDRARVPAIVLTTLVAAFVGQNVVAWLAAVLMG
jgi:hypothetical protein